SSILIVAFDRLIATQVWSWYESQASSTMLFFIAQEFFMFLITSNVSALLVYGERIPFANLKIFPGYITIQTMAYMIVYRRNLSEVRILKKGAVIHSYSLARTYQLNENITVMKMLLRIAGPMVASATPAILFFNIFVFVSPNMGYDGIRYFSVEMYDLWLAM
ncbi:hypothetical protein PFISCL1PPCAC_9725, partial [Pristionchus fissidentatus]